MAKLMLTGILLLVIVAIVQLNAQDAKPRRQRRKHVCPPASFVTSVPRTDGRRNLLRGNCEMKGIRRDTCKRRMSCCENSKGDMICIRARLYKPMFKKPQRKVPPMPPMPPMGDNMMQNDMEVVNSLCPSPLPAVRGDGGTAQACAGYDKLHTKCDTNFDCSSDRICCEDPCFFGKSTLKLCFLPSGFGFDGFQPPSITGSPPANRRTTSQKNLVSSTKKSPSPSTPPTPVSANLVFDDVEIPPRQCPEPDIQCNADGTECAVGCAAYDKSFTECSEDVDCASNRICCQDPCPNSPLKLCFPNGKNVNDKPNRAAARIDPPLPTKPSKPLDEGLDIPSKTMICPRGDFTSCAGWVADPNKKGTGTCKSQEFCAKDRKCCKITECGDDIHHCVKPVDPSLILDGCPIPKYYKENNFVDCSDGKRCAGRSKCCLLDVQGTMGCVSDREQSS